MSERTDHYARGAGSPVYCARCGTAYHEVVAPFCTQCGAQLPDASPREHRARYRDPVSGTRQEKVYVLFATSPGPMEPDLLHTIHPTMASAKAEAMRRFGIGSWSQPKPDGSVVGKPAADAYFGVRIEPIRLTR